MARQYIPASPFVAPTSGDIEQRLAELVQMINSKADTLQRPVYPAIGLIAPNGTVYQVTVDNAGVIHTATLTP